MILHIAQVYVIPRQVESSVDNAAHIAEALFGWPCEAERAGSASHFFSVVFFCRKRNIPELRGSFSAGSRSNVGVQVFSLRPHFAQHIANAWTTGSEDAKELHIQYVGYPEMPDFMDWSGPGQHFEDIDPDRQPPSRLMHAVIPLQIAEQNPELHGEEVTSNSMSMSMKSAGKMCEEGLLKQGTLEQQANIFSNNRDSENSVPLGCPERLPMKLHPSVLFSNSGVTREVCSRVLEFPQVNPLFCGKETRYVFGASSLHPFKNRPQQALGVYDCLTGQCSIWTRGWRYYVGEPEMVPSLPKHRRDNIPAELDGAPLACILCNNLFPFCHASVQICAGWILSICYDAARNVSEVVVLDAANISQGPVANATLPFVIPHGLHGTFVPDNKVDLYA